ncbi:3-oxoadipate enol-lactonase [Streptomyces sp. SID13031]|uniref:3-oxoadipate enol-lactonase n=1 Tax=Streptomyces sp. SID13031 TaxID=2706046 RepID=UPI0013CCC122|nr:3-oxoadipate enol-lactonase [Streptomyces sp. SID13031]NEA32851.1 3-oxoadipate enol-lactonase [Streptomyces sp. SID13031]
MPRLHCEVTGPEHAPVVVLANSLGATLRMWDPQIEALTQSYRVVRFDTRGHGGSPVPPGPYTIDGLADDVVELLDRLALEQVHYVGLSLGGMIGMRLAAQHPDRVDRLAVLCTSALLGPASMWHERAAKVRRSGTASVAGTVVARWYTDPFQERHPEVVAAAREMIGSTPSEGYSGCCEAIAAMDLTADLARITAPTLAIAGAGDLATPPDHLARIASTIPAAALLVVPEAAHLANAEQPDLVTAAILRHLQGT